ncbi:PREDICTED: serologically defined colon cancer antigen 3 homolog [Leptosomus discolor]|uniref:serologically defined colon cancer antigen 3 homolog n=1 Tax=Leptosomus discolor TaxID=188344 RepID=UPI000522B2CE|nr:PREDICTED: serologically defined colon cancer antigen 3 homolog [Leptosomus discolor]
MEKVCLESRGLEDDDNDDNHLTYFCCPAHAPPQCKSYDCQVKDLGEPVPFSLKPRQSYMVKNEGVKNRIYAKRLVKHALELEEEDEEFQAPLYKGKEMPGSLAKDEDHPWTCHLPVHQKSHVLPTVGMAPHGSCGSFQGSVGKDLGMDTFAPWAHASDPYRGYSEGSRGVEPHVLHKEAIGDREFPSLQPTYDTLREENAVLRRAVRSMQSSLESQACTAQRLERQLKASLDKEREVQKLQSFVQQTEQSLQLMTQRALEAKSNVEKLKREIFILQEELESSKVENENLRAGQMTDLGAVKQNTDFALQNLHEIIMGANWSIRELTAGVQSLHFVAEVLKSIGKIFEVEAEKEL